MKLEKYIRTNEAGEIELQSLGHFLNFYFQNFKEWDYQALQDLYKEWYLHTFPRQKISYVVANLGLNWLESFIDYYATRTVLPSDETFRL